MTVFRFNQGGSDGPAKVYTPRGLVQERQSNAVWGMQFIWPIKAEYRIIYLAPDYSQTVIGRTRRDYVWIMARQPSIPAEDYARIPIDELRARMDELPRKRDIWAYCFVGQRSYYAARALLQHGFRIRSVSGGYKT